MLTESDRESEAKGRSPGQKYVSESQLLLNLTPQNWTWCPMECTQAEKKGVQGRSLSIIRYLEGKVMKWGGHTDQDGKLSSAWGNRCPRSRGWRGSQGVKGSRHLMGPFRNDLWDQQYGILWAELCTPQKEVLKSNLQNLRVWCYLEIGSYRCNQVKMR